MDGRYRASSLSCHRAPPLVTLIFSALRCGGDPLAIVQFATAFRNAIEQMVEEGGLDFFEGFPTGCCDEASLFLATALREAGLGAFSCVVCEALPEDVLMIGGTEPMGHVWCQQGDLIVDITGDQFRDGPPPVLVTTHSSWHERLRQEPVSEFLGDLLSDRHGRHRAEIARYRAICRRAASLSYRPSTGLTIFPTPVQWSPSPW